jgi:cytochrome c-type biogenesis protein CcmH
MIWVFFAFMILVAFFIIIIPLFQSSKTRGVGKNEILEIYKTQLNEIEGEKKRGLLSQAQAKAAQLEIERIIIKTHNKKEEKLFFGGVVSPILVSGVLIIIGFFFYLNTGNPSYNNTSKMEGFIENSITEDDLEVILSKLESHLKANPDDIKAWGLMATSRLKQKKYFEASKSFERAFDLSGDVSFLIQQGESLINIADGRMTPASNLAFGTAMKLDPENPAPIYYLGLGRYQTGNIDGALIIWENLLEKSNETDPWVANLKNQINKARVLLGVSEKGF